MKNPRVFLDFQVGTQPVGRVLIELYADLVPKTAENFRGLCTGEYGMGFETNQPLSYVGCKVVRIIPGQYIQCGDFSKNNGTGGESVYGGKFSDENFNLWHANAGVLSMANDGPNSNGSQFLITLKKAAHLNRRHVVFGQVRAGMEILRAVERLPIDAQERPRIPIFITGSGVTDKRRRIVNDNHISSAEKGKRLLKMLTRVGRQEKEDNQENSETFDQCVEAAETRGEDTLETFIEQFEHSNEDNSEHIPVSREASSGALYGWRNLQDRLSREQQKNDIEITKEEQSCSRRPPGTSRDKRSRWSEDPKWYNKDTLGQISTRARGEAKKKRDCSFGWNVWNLRSVYQGYQKKLAKLRTVGNAHIDEIPSADAAGTTEHVPTMEGRQRLAEMFNEKKRPTRHHSEIEFGDVTYINRQNRKFNRKLEKAFGTYTAEIKQNLERGTAL